MSITVSPVMHTAEQAVNMASIGRIHVFEGDDTGSMRRKAPSGVPERTLLLEPDTPDAELVQQNQRYCHEYLAHRIGRREHHSEEERKNYSEPPPATQGIGRYDAQPSQDEQKQRHLEHESKGKHKLEDQRHVVLHLHLRHAKAHPPVHDVEEPDDVRSQLPIREHHPYAKEHGPGYEEEKDGGLLPLRKRREDETQHEVHDEREAHASASPHGDRHYLAESASQVEAYDLDLARRLQRRRRRLEPAEDGRREHAHHETADRPCHHGMDQALAQSDDVLEKRARRIVVLVRILQERTHLHADVPLTVPQELLLPGFQPVDFLLLVVEDFLEVVVPDFLVDFLLVVVQL